MLGAHKIQHTARGRGRKRCPPHGPHIVDAAKEGFYVARYLACEVAGPERQDVLEAKLGLDQRWH
jgi:hypothetical protein